MKRALCVNSMEDISNLIRGESETIDSSFVDRVICEDPNNKFLQVIPYVTFYTSKPAEGKIVFVQYLRAASGGDDRLLSKTSIGFGGHIDQLSDIKSTHANTAEDGTEHFVMSKQDLVDSMFTAAKRELMEELGINVLDVLGVSMDFNETAFFLGDQSEEVNQVHIGLSIPIKLTEEQFAKFFEIVQVNKAEIDSIDKMTLNVKSVIEEMDVTNTLGKIMRELKHKHNLEDWSTRVFDYISRKEIFIILKNVTYEDLYKISVEKEAMNPAPSVPAENSSGDQQQENGQQQEEVVRHVEGEVV